MKTISVIVPFFNEPYIKRNIQILQQELESSFNNYEIILVSDGSTDFPDKKLQTLLNEKIKLFHYPQNQGKGFALKFGFEQSVGDYIVFIDGGMELHPRDIKRFLGLMELYEADAVIGSKRHPQSKVYYPLSRQILSRIYQWLIRIFLNLDAKDTQVGLKLFKRKVLEKTLPKVLVKKYAFDLELLAVAHYLGFHTIIEAPITLDFRKNVKKGFFKDILHTLKVAWPLLWDTCAVFYRLKIIHYYKRNP